MYCHWGNEVKLYRHHVYKLYAMFRRKIPDIKYYVHTINKTFAKQGQRMYFQVHYTKENLKKYIKPDDDMLKVKLADSSLHTNSHIMLGTDKRATITRNWTEFRRHADIHKKVSAPSVSNLPQSTAWLSSSMCSRWTINNNTGLLRA
ncbi:hypothetical protein ACQJBY_031859 [Aegilops geniculata]